MIESQQLIDLVNEYRDFFTKHFKKLRCTDFMEVELTEKANSVSEISYPTKISQEDRKYIAKL